MVKGSETVLSNDMRFLGRVSLTWKYEDKRFGKCALKVKWYAVLREGCINMDI